MKKFSNAKHFQMRGQYWVMIIFPFLWFMVNSRPKENVVDPYKNIFHLQDTVNDNSDEIKVKVIDVDQQGKVKLSRKEALKDGIAAAVPAAT